MAATITDYMKRQLKKNAIGQMPLFQPKASWEPIPVSDMPSWAEAKRICIDLETCDPDLRALGPGVRRKNSFIAGISFAIEFGPSFYMPVNHLHGTNLEADKVFGYVAEQMKHFDGEIVGANLPYDMDYLMEAGVSFAKVKKFLDVQIAEPLIDELQDSYSLENIAGRHNLPGKDETLLREAASAYYVDPKKGLWQLPAHFVADYAIQDVELPLQIMRRQQRLIEDHGLGPIFDIESRLIMALLVMRRRGVLIDQAKLQQIEDWTITEQKKACSKVQSLSGITLHPDEVNKAGALAKCLQTIANVKVNRTPTGLPSVDTAFLQACKHPIADAIMRAKKMDKIRNTFVKSIRNHMTNGRLHATFNQMKTSSESEGDDDKGVRYGRLSSSSPNIQQQPGRDDDYDTRKKKGTLTPDDFHLGKLWRSIFIPEPGMKWAALDYSGQEPRMTVHYANIAKCQGGPELAAAYNENPDLDLHQKTADLAGIERKPAKVIFLGLAYGMGGAKLCHSLGLPTQWVHNAKLARMIEVAGPEGKAIIDRYNLMVPFLKQLTKKCEQRASERGFITTILGRQLHFPRRKDGKPGYDWLHKGLNRLVQGSAADQTKLAVVLAHEAGYELQLQVHDEIDMSVRDMAHAQEVAEIMRNCVPLTVPTKVDVELGDSWGGSMG